MQVIPQSVPEILKIIPAVHGDGRGYFLETWNARVFKDHGINVNFVQDNHSRSHRGTLRGLHYQVAPYSQGKLVRVTLGEVYDVAVDLRKGSPTFGEWVAEYLSADNKAMLWIPPGFAHGFYVTSDIAEFQYKCTNHYAPDAERAIRWDDSKLAINWPLSSGGAPRLSDKDKSALTWIEFLKTLPINPEA
jgi:dTDP-4-dehydrorhamnose 3,5-epimerase